MQAAHYYGAGDLRVEEVAEPALGETDVRIDVAACGICGTDLHEYSVGPDYAPSAGGSHPLTGASLPVPLGHEFSGTVSAVGEAVSAVSVGDPVTVSPAIVCNDCRYCAEGRHNLCASIAYYGLSARSGGFAERAVVDASNVMVLPEAVPVEYGALVEPFSVGIHAVRRSGLQAGDTAAVFGSGPIGLTIVQAARAAGATAVFVSEPRAPRRSVAREVGATTTLDPTATDVVAAIRAATDGGVDVAFEAVGIEPTHKAAVRSTKHGGRITCLGISNDDVGLTPNDVVLAERTITGSNGYLSGPRMGEEFEAAVSYLETGAFDAETMITGRVPLDDIVAGGFESLRDPESAHVKILVEP